MQLYQSIDDPGIEDPDELEVLAAIDRAVSIPETAAEEERVVILSTGPIRPADGVEPDLMQLLANPYGWVVEYADSHNKTLYRSPRGLPVEHVRGLFLSFLHGDDSYREAIHWRDVSHPSPRARRRSTIGIIVLVVAFLAGAAAIALLASLAL